jgi:nitrous oxidase accessory protein NosD
MSVQFCKVESCEEGVECSGLQRSTVANTQVLDCPTGISLLKLGYVYQCQVVRSSVHGVRFDPSCEITIESTSIKHCRVGVFNRSGGGVARSCALQMCDTGILLEGEVLTCFERCVADLNQKGCEMHGVLGSGVVKFCIFKRNRIFGLCLSGQGDPAFIVSENTFEDNTTGVLFNCTSAPLFVRNTVTKNLLSGVLFKPGCCVIFKQNRVIGNKGHGMQVMTNSSSVIEDNVVEKNEKFGVFFLTGQGANDLVFRKNAFHCNFGGGINVAPGSQGRIIEW